MNKESVAHDIVEDVLFQWWRPSNWFRIVYGIWVDQAWYWKNVRSHLDNQKQRWSIFVQGVIGVTLITVILFAIMGGMLEITGTAINWNRVAKSIAVILGVAVGIPLLTPINWLTVAGPNGVVCSVIIGITGSVGTITVFTVNKCVVSDILVDVFFGLVLGLVVGTGLGVFRGVVDGSKFSILESITLAIAPVMVYGLMGLIVEGITGGVVAILGLYLGGCWATRQVPDVETRRRLANPDI